MTAYSELVKDPNGLHVLLKVADVDDLHALNDYITDSGEGRLSLDSAVCKRLSHCRKVGEYSAEDRDLIATEILLFGGNSLANFYRGLSKGGMLSSVLPNVAETTDYVSVLKDVAKQVGAARSDAEDVQQLESAILLKIFNKALGEVSDDERQRILDDLGVNHLYSLASPRLADTAAFLASSAARSTALSISYLVARAVSTQMLGMGRVVLAAAPAALGVRTLSAVAGPIGMTVGALWTVAGLSSPAYRVTVPCVVQLAHMRQKYMFATTVTTCGQCSAANSTTSKFCGECGHPLHAT